MSLESPPREDRGRTRSCLALAFLPLLAACSTSYPHEYDDTPRLHRLAAGDGHTCARLDSGAVACRGHISLGDASGPSMIRMVPQPLPDVTDITELAAGFGHTCGARSSGAVACWGSNAFGQLGDGSMTDSRTSAVAPARLDDAVHVAAALAHTCALRRGGTVSCWGLNMNGEVGETPIIPGEPAPYPVRDLTGVVELTAGGHHTCARLEDRSVVCWGLGAYGELGDGTTTIAQPVPVQVTGLTDAIEVSAGDGHTCARRATGGVACWGHNASGQLGDATTTDRLTPVSVSGLVDAIQISAGTAHTCALRFSGSVVCWGDNHAGALGSGEYGPSTTPVAVAGLSDVEEIAAGGAHTCARTTAGRYYCWGGNDYGQLGDGTSTSRSTPVAVMGI